MVYPISQSSHISLKKVPVSGMGNRDSPFDKENVAVVAQSCWVTRHVVEGIWRGTELGKERFLPTKVQDNVQAEESSKLAL